MTRYLIWVGQFVFTAALVIIPLLWRETLILARNYPFIAYAHGERLVPNAPLIILIANIALLLFFQILDKRLAARESRQVVGDREFVESYAAAVKDSVRAAYLAHGMDADERRNAQRKILRAISSVVQYYYDKKEGLEINACHMLAYSTDSLPPGVERRVRFKERKRDLDTYAHVLDLILWAEDKPDLPKELALPVEDPTDHEFRHKLLPGAPCSFALEKVAVVANTAQLKDYFENDGKYVDNLIKKEQVEYFESQGFKSFASLPLEREGQKIGVLNIQSSKAYILGRGNEHQKLVVDLLDPLRMALGLLS